MQQLANEPDVRLLSLRSPYHFESPFGGQEFVLLLHSDDPSVSDEAQCKFADEIVASGCRYVCCTGIVSSGWEDAIDFAFIGTDPNYDPPDERFIMTAWFEDKSIAEVVSFAMNCTSFDEFVAERFLIVLLNAHADRAAEFAAAVKEYARR